VADVKRKSKNFDNFLFCKLICVVEINVVKTRKP